MAKRTLAANPDDKARALSILFNTYWTSKGWRCIEERPPAIPAHLSRADFEFAKRQGVMFDAVHMTRAQRRARLGKAASGVAATDVANAFVASLSTRALSIRSALGSFAFARHFPVHDCGEHDNSAHCCTVCGMNEPPLKDWYDDQNVLNFERHKWGGVRHTDEHYAALDLELFAREMPRIPTDADRDTLVNILNAVTALPPTARPGDIQKSLTPVLLSNKGERRMLVEILALSGILEPRGFPSYRSAFVDPFFAANSRTNIRTDWKYPIMHWRGSDGVNASAVAEWFPWAKLRKGKWTF